MGIAKRKRTRTKIRSGSAKKKRGNLLRQKARKSKVLDMTLRQFWDTTKTAEENFKALGLAADPTEVMSRRHEIKREIMQGLGEAGGDLPGEEELQKMVDEKMKQEDEARKEDELARKTKIEKLGGGSKKKGSLKKSAPDGKDAIKALEDYVASKPPPEEAHMSDGQLQIVEKLVLKHGTNFQVCLFHLLPSST
mmetsp:Transcript_9359/g.25429  ORF Transcript_9359/g.25429 Transcript_9359/m.25429 type:complete len:194 (-) Transcript_9359:193-774(-)